MAIVCGANNLDDAVITFKNMVVDGNEGLADKLRDEIREAQAKLDSIVSKEDEIDQFVEGLVKAFPGITADILLTNLKYRFPVFSSKQAESVVCKTVVKIKQPSAQEDAKAEYVLAVLTNEPMKLGEICKALPTDMSSQEVQRSLAIGISKGLVTTEGKYRSKQYKLVSVFGL